MDAITLETIHECLDAGGKLICTDADMGVHTYKNKDIASLSSCQWRDTRFKISSLS